MFKITAEEMAVLLLVNASITDIIDRQSVDADILDELEYLQPNLNEIILRKDADVA